MQHYATQRNSRICIMAAPCSGKSTFALKGVYRDIRLVDFNIQFEKWARESGFDVIAFSRITMEEREKVYNEVNIDYLYRQSEPVCILGVIGPENPSVYNDISFAIVQPPLLHAMRNCLRRNMELRKKRQASRWANWRNIREYRRKLLSYAKKNEVSIYPTFELAIDSVLK